ncbi:hypothetical protein PMIN05_007373 [Paraphaeosphaeria minitans]
MQTLATTYRNTPPLKYTHTISSMAAILRATNHRSKRPKQPPLHTVTHRAPPPTAVLPHRTSTIRRLVPPSKSPGQGVHGPGNASSPTAHRQPTSPASPTCKDTSLRSTEWVLPTSLAPSRTALAWATRASHAETISSNIYATSTTSTSRSGGPASAAPIRWGCRITSNPTSSSLVRSRETWPEMGWAGNRVSKRTEG